MLKKYLFAIVFILFLVISIDVVYSAGLTKPKQENQLSSEQQKAIDDVMNKVVTAPTTLEYTEIEAVWNDLDDQQKKNIIRDRDKKLLFRTTGER